MKRFSSEKTAYSEKYALSGASRAGSGEACFLLFLESLNGSEWDALIGDLFSGRLPALDVMRVPRGEDPLAYSAQLFNRLGEPVRRLIGQAVSHLLRDLVSESGSVEGAIRALSFAALLPGAVNMAVLMRLTSNDQIAPEVRFHAAAALSGRGYEVPLGFWQGIDVQLAPALLPPVVAALSRCSVDSAISKIGESQVPPAQPERMEYPLRMLLRRLGQREDALMKLQRLKSDVPIWLAEVLDKMLSHREFEHLRSLGTYSEEQIKGQGQVGILKDYLAGRSSGASLKSMAGEPDPKFLAAVSEAVSGWQPFGVHSLDYSMRLLGLVHSSSRTALGKVVVFLEEVLVRLSRASGRGDYRKLDTAAKAALQYLGQSGCLLAEIAVEEASGEQYIREVYLRSLRLALKRDSLYKASLDQLVRHEPHPGRLANIVRLALQQPHISGEDCLRALSLYFDREEAYFIIGSSLPESATDQYAPEPSVETLRIGAKLHRLRPSLLSRATAEAVLWYQDAAVEDTVSEWLAGLEEGLKPGLEQGRQVA